MRIRLLGLSQKQLDNAEKLFYWTQKKMGQDWRIATVSERLEVARCGVPKDTVALEVEGKIVYMGPVATEEETEFLVKNLIEQTRQIERRRLEKNME